MHLSEERRKKTLIARILENDILIQSYVEDDDPIPETELRDYSIKQLKEHNCRQEARLEFLTSSDYPTIDTFVN